MPTQLLAIWHPSTSEVTTVWRYRNSIITIIVTIISCDIIKVSQLFKTAQTPEVRTLF